MSFWPPPAIHQPSDASPTLSLPTKLLALQTDERNLYFTCSFMPFWAASVVTCEHGVPTTPAMKTSGFWAVRVVIGSVTLTADGSILSVTYSMLAFSGDCAR